MALQILLNFILALCWMFLNNDYTGLPGLSSVM